VYEPAFELPLKSQRYIPEMGAPGEPVEDLVLRAGDTLYLPRGWLHEALTSDSDSLHLTVGVNVYPWLEALRAALEECAEDVEFRRSVPDDGGLEVDLVERLRERLEPARVAARARERLVRTRRPILDGQLSALRALDSLGPESLVERRPTVLADLDGGTLSFEGKRLELPAKALAEVEALLEAPGPLRVRELPGGLDDESRVVLVRRLVREGFARLVPDSGADASA
jgi:hypothetical protein